jgi:hypothetical protein
VSEPRHDPVHRSVVHRRWLTRRNRRQEDPDYSDDWYIEQCGRCQYWIPLAGTIGLDWGICTNEASPLDGRAAFEHDGCEQFLYSETWAIPEDFDPSAGSA